MDWYLPILKTEEFVPNVVSWTDMHLSMKNRQAHILPNLVKYQEIL